MRRALDRAVIAASVSCPCSDASNRLPQVTVDLDVLGRAQLMSFVRQDCDLRGAVVMCAPLRTPPRPNDAHAPPIHTYSYATHIFDGLAGWATHYAFLEAGQLRVVPAAAALPPGTRLLPFVEAWLRGGKARLAAAPSQGCAAAAAAPQVVRNNGWAAGRLMPTRAPDVRGDETQTLGRA